MAGNPVRNKDVGRDDHPGRFASPSLIGGIPAAPKGCEDPFLQQTHTSANEEVSYRVPAHAGDSYAHLHGEQARYAVCSELHPDLFETMDGVTQPGEAPVLVGWVDDGPNSEMFMSRGTFRMGDPVEDVYLVAPVYGDRNGTLSVPLPGAESWGAMDGIDVTRGSSNRVRFVLSPDGAPQWLGSDGGYCEDPSAVVAETVGNVRDGGYHNFHIDDNCQPSVRFAKIRPQDTRTGGPVGAIVMHWYTRET